MYNAYSYNPYLNYSQPQAPARNDIRWVQGIVGAKAYQVPAGQTYPLFDSETEGVFYLKTTDQFNMSSMKIFKFTEIKEESMTGPVAPQVDLSNYVTKEEMNQKINDEISKLFEVKENE